MRRSWCSIVGVFLIVPGLAVGQTAAEKSSTLDFLRGLQTESGGFLVAPKTGKATLRATSSAARALHYFGGEVPRAQAVTDFVLSCFDKEAGGFADTPGGKPDVVCTAVGLMALVEFKAPTTAVADASVAYLVEHAKTFEEVRIGAAGLEAIDRKCPAGKAWLEVVAAGQNADGTYGKGAGMARATGGSLVAVLRLGGTLKDRDRALTALKEGQRADGGFGPDGTDTSDLETAYRVGRAFVMLREPPDRARLRTFVARCRNTDGGYGVSPGQPSSVSGTYYASYLLSRLLAE